MGMQIATSHIKIKCALQIPPSRSSWLTRYTRRGKRQRLNSRSKRRLSQDILAHSNFHRQIRECNQQGEQKRISQIIDQLVEMFNNTSNQLHIRNGGLIGLAGTAIALGVDVAPYMEKFVGPLLDCFVDPENRIRYFSAECLYNIAKVSKGEVLVYFNDIFDALSKVCHFHFSAIL